MNFDEVQKEFMKKPGYKEAWVEKHIIRLYHCAEYGCQYEAGTKNMVRRHFIKEHLKD